MKADDPNAGDANCCGPESSDGGCCGGPHSSAAGSSPSWRKFAFIFVMIATLAVLAWGLIKRDDGATDDTSLVPTQDQVG